MKDMKIPKDVNPFTAPEKVAEFNEKKRQQEGDYIKTLGGKEYLDELWSKVDEEVECIHKRLGDTWNHPTCEEVTWFHDSWRRLYKTLEEYQAAEIKYLPQEEQPKPETAIPGIIKNERLPWEFMTTTEADGIYTLNGFNELEVEEEKDYIDGKVIEGKHAYIEEYEVGETPDQTEEITCRYGHVIDDNGVKHSWHPTAPTTILSKAIEQVEQMGDYKVMVALVDLDKTKPKDERLYTFTDIESKKLREVIYKEMEKDFQ